MNTVARAYICADRPNGPIYHANGFSVLNSWTAVVHAPRRTGSHRALQADNVGDIITIGD